MKSSIAFAAFAASANALIGRTDSCCFHLMAPNGTPVGQLSDGQNRIGDSSLPKAEYCISSDGAITDGNGRGCILTPPTTQFQCDTGATPTPGFSISSSGMLEFNGSPKFIVCETGQNGGENIHTAEPIDLGQCSNVELKADSCAGSGFSAPPPSSSGSSPGSSPSSPSSSCPTTLGGSFEFPHLIVPVDSSSPDTAGGTKFNGVVSSTVSTIFNFDIPQSDEGKQCSLVFLFPEQADLQTSSFTFKGDGKIDVAELDKAASTSTTFNNAPAVSKDLGDITVSPGHSYVVSTFSCPAGQTVAFEMKNAGSTDLEFFEDFNPSPIGLFITKC
jgi:hypothetical protein